MTLPTLRGIRHAQVSARDDYSMAVTSDGSLYSWGSNENGELGDGTAPARSKPVKVDTPDGTPAGFK